MKIILKNFVMFDKIRKKYKHNIIDSKIFKIYNYSIK